MLMRHRVLAPLILVSLFSAGTAWAGDTAFDTATFDALLKQGKPILVSVHADWCPTCRAQAPIVADLLATPELQGITALRVDFDSQKDVRKRFRVTYQSTLIVFKGGQEVGRSTGETDKQRIAALLRRAI